MLRLDELARVQSLKENYSILICNAHDVHLQSRTIGHEWIIISPYDGGLCEILHRHSCRDPFHHQHGRYASLVAALAYIQGHDEWYSRKRRNEVDAKM